MKKLINYPKTVSKIPKVFLFCKEYKDIQKIEDLGLLWHQQLSLLLSLETLSKEEINVLVLVFNSLLNVKSKRIELKL